MQTIEFDGLPAGVAIQINNIIVIGTAPVKQEKESA
jgi:hypothetical protein